MAKKKPVKTKQLTEAEKKKLKDKKIREAKHKEEETESETESEGESETESESEDEGGADDQDADHPDADKDIALIKKMIGEHLGDKTKDMTAEEMESLQSLAHEAYQAHKEMGNKEEEAYSHAGHALKLAHHMSKKEKTVNESEDEGEELPPKKKKPAPKADDGADSDDDGDEDEPSETETHHEGEETENENKESKREKALTKKLLEAEGRIAALEAKTKKAEVLGHVDMKLKESKQPSSITKRFREAAGEFKSKADFDAKWKVFLAGVQDNRVDLDFGLFTEKSTATEDGDRTKTVKGLDFSKCAE